MKVYDVPQGGVEWSVLRYAIPTASQYARILTPAKLKYAAAAELYQAELLAAWALGGPLDGGGSGFTERGQEMEAEARAWYQWERDVEVERVGFIARDDGRTGGSPDGLVGEDGGAEIKCLSAANHMRALLALDVGDDYKAQIQGLLYLTDRAWFDLVLYHPTFPRRIERIHPDEAFIGALEPALARFLAELDEGREKLLAMGFRPSLHLAQPVPVPESSRYMRAAS